jgi:hypothetical protein
MVSGANTLAWEPARPDDFRTVGALYSTTALWTILFPALVLGWSEAIGRRLVLAAVLVVVGGALYRRLALSRRRRGRRLLVDAKS